MKILGLICSFIMITASYSITWPFGFMLGMLGLLLYSILLDVIIHDSSVHKLIEQDLAEYEVGPKTGETEVVWTNKTLPGKPVYLG